MTAPIDITTLIPSKAKAWVGLIGALLTVIGPWILQAAVGLPQPWPGIVGLFFAALTAAGVYKAPYKPEGTVLAIDPTATTSPTAGPNTPVAVPAHQIPDVIPGVINAGIDVAQGVTSQIFDQVQKNIFQNPWGKK